MEQEDLDKLPEELQTLVKMMEKPEGAVPSDPENEEPRPRYYIYIAQLRRVNSHESELMEYKLHYTPWCSYDDIDTYLYKLYEEERIITFSIEPLAPEDDDEEKKGECESNPVHPTVYEQFADIYDDPLPLDNPIDIIEKETEEQYHARMKALGPHIQVEYDLKFNNGSNYSKVGDFAYIPESLVKEKGSVEAAFVSLLIYAVETNIIHYSEDERYTANGDEYIYED